MKKHFWKSKCVAHTCFASFSNKTSIIPFTFHNKQLRDQDLRI